MATPYVTGTAALLLSANLALTTQEIKSNILSNVDVNNQLNGKVNSAGIINAFTALGGNIMESRISYSEYISQINDTNTDNSDTYYNDEDTTNNVENDITIYRQSFNENLIKWIQHAEETTNPNSVNINNIIDNNNNASPDTSAQYQAYNFSQVMTFIN